MLAELMRCASASPSPAPRQDVDHVDAGARARARGARSHRGHRGGCRPSGATRGWGGASTWWSRPTRRRVVPEAVARLGGDHQRGPEHLDHYGDFATSATRSWNRQPRAVLRGGGRLPRRARLRALVSAHDAARDSRTDSTPTTRISAAAGSASRPSGAVPRGPAAAGRRHGGGNWASCTSGCRAAQLLNALGHRGRDGAGPAVRTHGGWRSRVPDAPSGGRRESAVSRCATDGVMVVDDYGHHPTRSRPCSRRRAPGSSGACSSCSSHRNTDAAAARGLGTALSAADEVVPRTSTRRRDRCPARRWRPWPRGARADVGARARRAAARGESRPSSPGWRSPGHGDHAWRRSRSQRGERILQELGAATGGSLAGPEAAANGTRTTDVSQGTRRQALPPGQRAPGGRRRRSRLGAGCGPFVSRCSRAPAWRGHARADAILDAPAFHVRHVL